MATIAIPLGENPVMRVSNGHLAIEAGGICVIFALHSTPGIAQRQLNQLVTIAQEALGGIAWQDVSEDDPMKGLKAWSEQTTEVNTLDRH